MNIQEIIEKVVCEFPLSEQIESGRIFYQLDKRRYLLFWGDVIKKEHINEILDYILKKTSNSQFQKFRTIIIVGETIDAFEKEDLVHCYMSHTRSLQDTTLFVNFYLINEKAKKIYMEDSWIYPIGLGYRKIVRRLDKIIKSRIEL